MVLDLTESFGKVVGLDKGSKNTFFGTFLGTTHRAAQRRKVHLDFKRFQARWKAEASGTQGSGVYSPPAFPLRGRAASLAPWSSVRYLWPHVFQFVRSYAPSVWV